LSFRVEATGSVIGIPITEPCEGSPSPRRLARDDFIRYDNPPHIAALDPSYSSRRPPAGKQLADPPAIKYACRPQLLFQATALCETSFSTSKSAHASRQPPARVIESCSRQLVLSPARVHVGKYACACFQTAASSGRSVAAAVGSRLATHRTRDWWVTWSTLCADILARCRRLGGA
jgi:hypothetical protein